MNATKEKITLQFLGAAETVTGSKYLLRAMNKTILVDCGLFQGLKELRLLNWQSLPVDASEVDLVLLTHGHLDHTGFLPRFVKDGFRGEIWATAPTLDIANIILSDSARIQEEDAERANDGKFSKHSPALPLYTTKDVENTIPLFRPKTQKEWINIAAGVQCRFNYNGHILGASFIEFKIGEKVIVFSGDIGREDDPLLYDPTCPEAADVIVMESTYGDRLHPHDTLENLASEINKALKSNGTVIIPSFAVERTQLLMHLICKLQRTSAIPKVPIYMDSPMGTNVLEVFSNHKSWHKLSDEDAEEMMRTIHLVRSVKETYELAGTQRSKIIIAGSGMASGGRVLTYLAQYLGDTNATILLAGYQAEGTRGRALLEGADQIKLFGKYFSVKASIANVQGLSSHADQAGLINWLSHLKKRPSKIFIVHGELAAAKALQEKILETYKLDAIIPHLNESFII